MGNSGLEQLELDNGIIVLGCTCTSAWTGLVMHGCGPWGCVHVYYFFPGFFFWLGYSQNAWELSKYSHILLQIWMTCLLSSLPLILDLPCCSSLYQESCRSR